MAQIKTIYSPEVEKQLKSVYSELEKHHKKVVEMSKMSLDFAGGKTVSSPAQLQKVEENYKKITQSAEKLRLEELRLQKAREKAFDDYEKKLQRQAQTQARASQQAQANAQREGQANLRLAQTNHSLNRAYNLLNENHKRAKEHLQDLIARGQKAGQTQKQYNQELAVARQRFQDLNTRVLRADHAVGQFNRNVGNYRSALSGLAGGLSSLMGAFGVAGGLFIAVGLIQNAFKSIKEFDQATADLAATMGKSRSEITNLTEDAKRLGGTTKWTATEITGLQKELAKLGFSQTEILNSTKAVQELASAVGTDLNTATEVAGATLRGFDLDAREMQRVVDVMASSFTKSALDISNFRESMKYVAPMAKASGVSIEFATAMLGKLADAGIKGSMAGTSLRRILTEMAKTGKPAAEAFDMIAKSGMSVGDAMDEVGRTAQTSLLILSKSKDEIFKLNDALELAGGTAKKMAKEQLNTLQGSIILMTSAWDGFIQSLNSGDGVLAKTIKKLVDFGTETINLWQKITKTNKELANDEVQRQITLGAEQFNKVSEKYNKILDLRNAKEKELDLLKKGDLTNPKLIERIKLTEKELAVLTVRAKSEKSLLETKQNNIIKEAEELKGKAFIERTNHKLSMMELQEQLEVEKQKQRERQKSLGLNESQLDNLRPNAKIIDLQKQLTKATKDFNEANKDVAFAIGVLNATKKESKKIIEEETENTEENTKKEKDNTKAKKEKIKVVEELLKGTEAYYNKLISDLREEQRTLADNSTQWKIYADAIAEVEAQLDNLKTLRPKDLLPTPTETGAGLDAGIQTNRLDSETQAVIDYNNALKENIRKLKEWQQANADAIHNAFGNDLINNSGLFNFFDLIENGLDRFGDNWQAKTSLIMEATQEMFNFISNLSQANFDREYRQEAQRKEMALMFVGESAEARANIEAESERRIREIRKREAKAQRSQAIFNIGVDTAQAIMNIFASTPPPKSFVLSALVGGIGIAQMAAVASRPLPEFWKGTDNAPEGWALTQEKGREIIKDKSGKIKSLGTDKGSQLTYLEKGDKVLKHADTINELNKMLSFNQILPPINNNVNFVPLQNEIKGLRSDILNKESFKIVNDSNGTRYFQQKNGQNQILNNARLEMRQRYV